MPSFILYAIVLRCFRKIAKSDYYSVCPSVCLSTLNNLAPTQWTLIKFEYFLKICRENKSFVKSDKNNFNVLYTKTNLRLFYQCNSFLLRKRNVSGKVVEKNQNTF
jgi:hypothetical protein